MRLKSKHTLFRFLVDPDRLFSFSSFRAHLSSAGLGNVIRFPFSRRAWLQRSWSFGGSRAALYLLRCRNWLVLKLGRRGAIPLSRRSRLIITADARLGLLGANLGGPGIRPAAAGLSPTSSLLLATEPSLLDAELRLAPA